jgi:putative tricarboxylic transport membrane protein
MLLEGIFSLFSVSTLLLIFFGVVVGIIFGAIPGLTAAVAIALCLPVTYGLDAVRGLSLLCALFVGGISGGLISAILLNIPGTPSSIATTFDGVPMAKNGEAGKALGVGILYSFLGTILGVVVLIFLAPPIANFALKFAPYEYFAVSLFALTLVGSLSSKGKLVYGLIAACLGMSIGMVGAAPIDSLQRFSFGSFELSLGFKLISVLIGFYAIPEVIASAKEKINLSEVDVTRFEIHGFGISMSEFITQIPNFLKSSIIGLVIGILPAIGSGTSNILAYGAVKDSSKYPEKFGTGIIDGVIASESSNNAGIGGALITLLTLGIPGDAVTAMMLGGFMMQGIIPGPMLIRTNGSLVYSIFGALIIASIFMLIIEFGGIRLFVKLLKIKKGILLPVVVCLCMVGSFALNNRAFDTYAMIFCGLLGLVFSKMEIPVPPVILGFILGPILETNLRRGLQLSRGNFLPFVSRPICIFFLALTVLSMVLTLVRSNKKQKSIA